MNDDSRVEEEEEATTIQDIVTSAVQNEEQITVGAVLSAYYYTITW